MRKPAFRICENKAADQLRSIAAQILSNSEISSHLLWLYNPVCVRPGRKTRRPFFLRHGSICTGRNVIGLSRQEFLCMHVRSFCIGSPAHQVRLYVT